MQKELKYILSVLTVTAGIWLLAQLPVSAWSDYQQHASATLSHTADEPLIAQFEQLLPPFLNSEGPGVKQVEPLNGSGFRILNENYEFRNQHACQMTHLQLEILRQNFLHQLADREKEGFYLYELCKLLI